MSDTLKLVIKSQDIISRLETKSLGLSSSAPRLEEISVIVVGRFEPAGGFEFERRADMVVKVIKT